MLNARLRKIGRPRRTATEQTARLWLCRYPKVDSCPEVCGDNIAETGDGEIEISYTRVINYMDNGQFVLLEQHLGLKLILGVLS